MPQEHLPGAEAEVDFGEFHAVVAGTLLQLWMFVLRLSYSGGRCMSRSRPRRRRRSWKGMCWRPGTSARIRYDNLKPAVVRVLPGPGPGRGGAVQRGCPGCSSHNDHGHPRLIYPGVPWNRPSRRSDRVGSISWSSRSMV